LRQSQRKLRSKCCFSGLANCPAATGSAVSQTASHQNKNNNFVFRRSLVARESAVAPAQRDRDLHRAPRPRRVRKSAPAPSLHPHQPQPEGALAGGKSGLVYFKSGKQSHKMMIFQVE
jgi:hypothetical protein